MSSRDLKSIDPHSLVSVRLKTFWAMVQLGEDGPDRFKASALANYMVEVHEICTSRQAVEAALRTSGSCVHKNKDGYKLMEEGRKQLLVSSLDGEVIMIEPGKPYSAQNVALKKILSPLKSPVSVCDPYLDLNTLDVLHKNLQKSSLIRVLTQNVQQKPSGVVERQLKELRKEGYSIEVGIYTSSALHDRYIFDNKTFWLSGNSLNHLGNKESFLVRLGGDIHQSMQATFNSRWKGATKI